VVSAVQYPDILTYEKVIGGGSSYDEDGNLIIDPIATETVSLRCRAEANTKGQYLISDDGHQVEYDWVIYFPHQANEIPYGTPIQVTRNGTLRATGIIKRSVVDQLNARAWV